jgi:hypothetical protein
MIRGNVMLAASQISLRSLLLVDHLYVYNLDFQVCLL